MYSLFLTDFNKTTIIVTDFLKICKYQISWKSVQMGGELFHENRRTDMTKLIDAFRNFSNAPKSRKNRFSSNLILAGFTESVHDIPLSDAISGFRRDADEVCALLRYYAQHSGKSVPTFRDKLSGPSSRVKKSKTLDP